MLWQLPALVLVGGYLLGSIPFGVLLTRMFGAGDLRAIGSGNIGATNVLRTGRKGLAAATLLLDLAKGALAVVLGRMIGPEFAMMAGFAAFLGHLFPVWLKFRGGKGVATMMGVCLGLAWPLALVFALVWVGMLALTRRSSVGGITAALAAPVAALAMPFGDYFPGLLGMALIVVWKHADNIRRLIDGTEPKVGQKPA